MPTYNISKERVADACNVIIQFLRDAGYTGSLEDGTGLNDIVVKPNALIYELMAQMVDKAYAYQSLQKAYELKSVIGQEEYDAAVDGILSNWFVSRNEGTPGAGTIRMWFSNPPDFMMFSDGQVMCTVNGETLVADGTQAFGAADYSCVINTVNNHDEYYTDVLVRTNGFSDTEIAAGTQASVAYDDIYFLRAEIPADFTPGTLVESSEHFIRRTEKAITTRELITDRAINTVLMDTFDELITLYVARHGSSEQLRDIIEFYGALVHVGNKADIYLASTLVPQRVTVTVGEEGDVDVNQLPKNCTIVDIMGASSEGMEEEIFYPMSVDEKLHCSAGNLPLSLSCPGIAEGAQVEITMLTDTLTNRVQDFVYSDAQRVACYDPLVKHMFAMVLYPVIEVELIDDDVDPTEEIRSAAVAYINGLVVGKYPWVASELVAYIHNLVPNVRKVHLPIACEGRIFDPLHNEQHIVEIGNKFSVDENYLQDHSKQITSNTVQFYADTSTVTVTIV